MRIGAKALGLFLLGAAATAASPARAVVVERIVAIVGDKPILLSELRGRARPFLLQIQQRVPAGAQQTAAESQMLKDLIDKMVDEELETQAAEKSHTQVTEAEIDSAFATIAASQGLSVAQLFREAQMRSGLSEAEYHDEIKRQLLEGKMLQLRVKGRVRITEEDVKAMYERTLREEKKVRLFHPAWIVLRIMPGSSAESIASRWELARQLVAQARAGADFASLAAQYSDDTSTRNTGGDLGVRAPVGSPNAMTGKNPTVAPDLDEKIFQLEVGQTAEPFKFGDAVVVVKLMSRQVSRYTTYDAAKVEMVNKLQAEILERAKRKWLDELKSRSRVTVRL